MNDKKPSALDVYETDKEKDAYTLNLGKSTLVKWTGSNLPEIKKALSHLEYKVEATAEAGTLSLRYKINALEAKLGDYLLTNPIVGYYCFTSEFIKSEFFLDGFELRPDFEKALGHFIASWARGKYEKNVATTGTLNEMSLACTNRLKVLLERFDLQKELAGLIVDVNGLQERDLLVNLLEQHSIDEALARAESVLPTHTLKYVMGRIGEINGRLLYKDKRDIELSFLDTNTIMRL